MTPEAATLNSPRNAAARTVDPLAVLETKLYTPKWRPGLVSRPRLIARLDEGADQQLTVVSAPAGFGKTTLLAEWLAKRTGDARTAWVSLDRSENEAPLFWAYVIRALQHVQPGLGDAALSMLRANRQTPATALLTSIINEVSACDRDVVLVLDDYHVIDSPQVHAGVSFLVDHLPPRMQLVITSRSEPDVPLAKLRARGQVTELRTEDLRFTPDEVKAFLNEVMTLDLSAADMTTLETRTEGWIAGLKLAALSLKNHGDVQKFVQAFSGDNRYIADYLIQEVLLAQREDVRRFLLGTAVLDRLSGPLCDAVTGERGSQAQLDSLEHSNLFVVPLDDTRSWYRYHHLFAEVLRAHALRTDAEHVRTQHRRASLWFEANGSHADAVHHAAASGDEERVAHLLETRWPSMDRSYQTIKWFERVKALPAALVRGKPVLNVAYAWTLMNAGELDAAEARLVEVEASLRDTADVVINDGQPFRSLRAALASARTYLAQSRGETTGIVTQAQQVLAQIPERDYTARATATALVSLAQWGAGDLENAHDSFIVALALMRAAGQELDAIRGEFVPADIRVGQGRLNEAAHIYEHGLKIAKVSPLTATPETDELHLGLSEVHLERGDVEAATRLLSAISEATGRTEHVGNRVRWCMVMSRVAEVRGDLPRALDLLDEAERVDVKSPIPRVRPIPAVRARIWIAQGRIAEARGWAKSAALSVDDEFQYIREFEHLTLVRLLIARYRADRDERTIRDALALLERLLIAASQGGRRGSVIEVLVLESLAHQAMNNLRLALDPLDRALTLAEPEGYLRIFVDEGDAMRDLLRHATARGVSGDYTRRLLRVFDGVTEPATPPPPPVVAALRPMAAGEPLLHDLTARELEILRLIAAAMRNQEIAEQLAISPATVKRHLANAYAKLGVSHRTEALARAHALNLL